MKKVQFREAALFASKAKINVFCVKKSLEVILQPLISYTHYLLHNFPIFSPLSCHPFNCTSTANAICWYCCCCCCWHGCILSTKNSISLWCGYLYYLDSMSSTYCCCLKRMMREGNIHYCGVCYVVKLSKLFTFLICIMYIATICTTYQYNMVDKAWDIYQQLPTLNI